MSRTYISRKPLDETRAPCHPSQRMDACYVCTRWRLLDEPEPEARENEVIDASVIWINGACGMFDPKPAVKAYCEVEA